jgi:hypothetical protein
MRRKCAHNFHSYKNDNSENAFLWQYKFLPLANFFEAPVEVRRLPAPPAFICEADEVLRQYRDGLDPTERQFLA